MDDDHETCALLSAFLSQHGYRVSVVSDGRAMLRVLKTTRINLIVLDLMLPGEDGLALCRRLSADRIAPIIILTALGESTDRIIGLEMGADDYLPKVADPRELLARIRAVLRRSGALDDSPTPDPPTAYMFAGWRLDVARRQLISPAQALVPLRTSEFTLLLTLLERPQQVLNRDQLIDLSRGRAPSPFDRSIDILVSRLRRKLESDPKAPVLIRTVRNGGYVLSATVESVGPDR